MTEQRKRQHYIPQFYLREFAAGSKQSQIYCFDKKTGKAFSVSTKGIGAENYFYDVEGKQDIEVAFSKLESKFSIPYQALLKSKNTRKLSEDDRIGLAVLIATQTLRTRSFRNLIKQATDFTLQNKENFQNNPNEKLIQQLEAIVSDETAAKRFQYTLMDKSISSFAASLLRMKWVLFINKTNVPFWSSDDPFTYSNAFNFDKYDGLGFERPGSQTHFPLSPNISLEIVDPIAYFDYSDVLTIDDEKNIIFNNHLQVKNSLRYVFSCENDFALAEEMIREDPQLREPDNNRFNDVEITDGKINPL